MDLVTSCVDLSWRGRSTEGSVLLALGRYLKIGEQKEDLGKISELACRGFDLWLRLTVDVCLTDVGKDSMAIHLTRQQPAQTGFLQKHEKEYDYLFIGSRLPDLLC